jgi:putative Ca2+/H+ antiporter (TMEM165/GDT1 family)
MLKALGTAFGLTFIAELGDKTQIAILTLAARYGWLPVFVGAAGAFVLLDALAVTVGGVIGRYVPADIVRYVSAAVFIIFGLLSFRREKEEEEETQKTARNPFLTAFLYVALLELGDKTQLSLVALTSRFKMPFWVFLGGTAALVLTSFIGAIVGKWLARVVPMKWIRWASGAIFIAFGVLIAFGVIRG